MNTKKHKLLLFIIIFLFISFMLYSKSPLELYQKGKMEYFDENYDTAIYYFKKAIEINENYIEPLIELAHLYYDIENYDYAYNYINKALHLSPKKNNLIIFSADIETKLERYNIAEKKYKSVLKNDPLNINAYNGISYLYLKTNKMILAKQNLDNVLKTDPDNFDALLMTANYYELIDDDKEEEYYILNIEKNSLNPDTYFYYSIYNFKNSKIYKAIQNIQTALEIADKIKYKKYYGKYLLFLNRGDDALQTFQQIIKKEKNNYLIYYYLASAYYIISDFESAVESLKKAIHLREDDEVSSYFLNSILIDIYNVDNEYRKTRANYFYSKAFKAKKESQYDLYVYYLKEAIRLYPKDSKTRIELANYFLSLNLPERYIRELKVASKYSNDKNLLDRIEIEQNRISYKLGDDWNINQYLIEPDLFNIPIFINKEINNKHYNCEKIFLYVLKNASFEKTKYDIALYDEKDYDTPEKMKISKDKNSPFFLGLKVIESGNSINITLKLINSTNNELIKEYKTTKMGNDRIVTAANHLLTSVDNDISFKAHILKISKDRAIINAGRKSGVNLKDRFIILQNKEYPIELNRASFIYNFNDIKGYGIAVKVDENITEIKFKGNEFFRDIDVDDIVIRHSAH